MVGAQWADSVNTSDNSGSAYTFKRAGGRWTEQAKLTAADTEARLLGVSVGLSREHAIVGASFSNAGVNIAQGAAYAFDLRSPGTARDHASGNG